MKVVTLTIKKNKETRFNRWDVKNGRKLHASIYQVREGADAGRFQIVKCGLCFYRDTLEGAKAFVIEQAEDFLNMLNFDTKVEIKERD